MTVDLRPRPPVAQPRVWGFPKTERGRLSNGIDVVLCDLPERPIIEVKLVFKGGVRREPRDLLGVANVAARALSEGTARHDGESFNDLMESLGANYGFSVDWNATVASLSVPQRRLSQALMLLAEAVYEPAFRGEDVERLVRQRIVGLESSRLFPGPRAQMTLAREAFEPGSRMAVVGDGTPETLGRVDHEAVRSFWAATSAAENATVIVAGDLRGLQIEEMLDQAFGSAGVGAVDDRPDAQAEVPVLRRAVVVDFPGAVQSHLLVGHAGPTIPVGERAVVALAGHCLGGFTSSRLNTVLREEKSLTYGVNSTIDHRGPAFLFKVETAVQRDATVEAVHDILNEVDSIARNPIAEDLFADSVANLTRTAPTALRSTASVAGTLSRTVQEGLPDDYYDQVQRDVLNATPEQTSAMFARHVRAEDLCIVVAGDAADFAEDLARERPDVVVEPRES